MPQDTELHKVAKDGDVPATQDLLGTGANVNALGAQGRTALHRALGGGHAECAKVLLEAGADATIIDQMKRTSLHYAILAPNAEGALACLNLLSEHSPVVCESQINNKTKSGTTPLHCACSSGRAEMARWLLERGADASIEDEDGKPSAVLAKEAGIAKEVFGSGSACPPPARKAGASLAK